MLILHGITSGWKPLKDGLEIKWHNEALLWILDVVKWEYPITEVFIRELNKKILGDPYEIDAITAEWIPTKRRITPWEYKTQPNHVKTKTGELFRFAEPFETPAKMEDLINWFRWEKDKQDIDPILTAIEFHYRFIRIHPFDDGNGRTVRILMNFILMQYGYPPAIIKTEEKEWYYSALRQADTGDLLAFFEYITRDVIHSLDIMLRGANGENIDDEDDIDKEIRLLKWELSNGENKKFLSKKEKIEYVLENNIIPFIKKNFESLWDFDDFYHYPKSSYSLIWYKKKEWLNLFAAITKDLDNQDLDLKKIEKDDLFNIDKYITNNQDIDTISFILKYAWLNLETSVNSYTVRIIINFSLESYYEISINNIIWNSFFHDILQFKKTYTEPVLESEQKEILRLIKQDHLNFIKSHKN